jgi:hypothetical protein
MDSTTGQFVDKIRDTQTKNLKNKKHHGKGNPDLQLPGKRHSKTK